MVYSHPNLDYRNWHTYAIEWNANKITWYLDGKQIRTRENSNLDNFGHSIIDPVKIRFGANVVPKALQPPYSTASFEEYMYVDYVKVYQLKCGNEVIDETQGNGYNFNNYTYNVKESCIFKNTSIPNGANMSIRATDFIELKENFEVPLGAELYLDVTPCVIQGRVRAVNN